MKWGILLSLIVSSAYASIDIKTHRGDLESNEIIAASKVIDKILAFSPLSQKPTNLIIDIVAADTEAYYAPSNYIFLPLRMRSYVDYYELQGQKLTEAVWVHEIAHAILNVNLASDIDKFSTIFDFYKKRDWYINKLDQLDRNSDDYKKLSPSFVANNHRLAQESVKLYPVIPYDELFADIYTVLYYNDFQIMEKALTYQAMSANERQAAEHRDFTENFTTAKRDDHTYLSPSKYHFWKRVKDCPIHTYNSLVSQTYTIIKKIIANTLNGKVMDQQEANQLLIEKFNQLDCGQ